MGTPLSKLLFLVASVPTLLRPTRNKQAACFVFVFFKTPNNENRN